MSYITPDSIDSIDIEEEGEEEDDDEEKEKEEDDAPQSESKSMTQNGMSLRKKITKSFESLFTFDEDYEEGQSHKVKTILIVIITIVILTIIVVPIVVSQTKDSKWSVYGGNMSMLTFDKPEVNLSCYTVHGMTENEVYVFKGIPYAAAPVGDLRWKPPQDVASHEDCWNDMPFHAREFGAICSQYNETSQQMEGAEDCLYINVWTSQLHPDNPMEVMVYIHGGGLMRGSGNEWHRSPNSEVTQMINVVFVSFNYRLNAFGFLALDLLGRYSPGQAGNYGLLDQIQALKWVQNNIALFGGDPNRVTVFGDGAGATSILTLLGLRQAVGLFHRAWLLSPSPGSLATLREADRENQQFVRSACGRQGDRETYLCLKALSPEEVNASIPYHSWMNTARWGLPDKDETTHPLLVVDGELITHADPVDAWVGEVGNRSVPVLIGSMAQEVDVSPGISDLNTWDPSYYDSYLQRKLRQFALSLPDLAQRYYPITTETKPELHLTTMVSDIRAVCPTNAMARSAARRLSTPIYRYITQLRPIRPAALARNVTNRQKYAFHGMDLLAFFGHVYDFADPATEKETGYRDNLRLFITDFVRHGQLRFDCSPYPDTMGIVTFVLDCSLPYNNTRCDFWMRSGLVPKYQWIN